MKKYLILFVALYAIYNVCSLEKVTLRTIWLPQAQFAGYFAAKEKGFYRDEGLDVTILNGGPDINAITEAAHQEVDFALSWLSGAIQSKSQGMPIVCVAQFFPKSMLVLVTTKNTGIKKIDDMNRKKVGVWQSIYSVPIKALMKVKNVHPIYINEGFDMQPFIDKKYDDIGEVISTMLYNEYNIILSSGISPDQLIVFNPSDYGANFPEDGLYVSEKTWNEKQETIKKIIRATVKGWNYAIANQNEAVDIVMKYGAKDKNHQKNMLKIISENIILRNKSIGYKLSKADFDFVYNRLKDYDMLGNKNIKYEDFYKEPK